MTACRERWWYSGRGLCGPNAVDCYRWFRFIEDGFNDFGEPHYKQLVYAHPVATFWPQCLSSQAPPGFTGGTR